MELRVLLLLGLWVLGLLVLLLLLLVMMILLLLLLLLLLLFLGEVRLVKEVCMDREVGDLDGREGGKYGGLGAEMVLDVNVHV